MRTLNPVSRRLVALAAVSGLILTGCGSTVRGGEAARIGDEGITVATIERYVDDYTEESGEETVNTDAATTATQWYLSYRISKARIELLADKVGVSTTKAEAHQLVEQANSQVGRSYESRQQFVKQTNLTDDVIADVAYMESLRQKIGEELFRGREVTSNDQAQKIFAEELNKAAEEEGADISINPRYGTWDEGQGQLDEFGGVLVKTQEMKQQEQREEAPAPSGGGRPPEEPPN